MRGTKARTTIIFTITRMTVWSTGRCNPAGLARYNSVLLYDRDGASVGNLRCLSTEKLGLLTFEKSNIVKIRSPLWRAYTRLKNSGLEPKVGENCC